LISPKTAAPEHRAAGLALQKLLRRRKHTSLVVGLGIDRICVAINGYTPGTKIAEWQGYPVEWSGRAAQRATKR